MRIALAPSSAPGPLHTPGSITRFDPFFASRTHACPSLVSRTIFLLESAAWQRERPSVTLPPPPEVRTAAPGGLLTMIGAGVTFRAGRWQFAEGPLSGVPIRPRRRGRAKREAEHVR